MYKRRTSFICIFITLFTFLNTSSYNYAETTSIQIGNHNDDSQQNYATAEAGNQIESANGESEKNIRSIYIHSAISYNNKIFVVIGEKGKIFTSGDGVKWSKCISGTFNNLNSIVWNGTRFVVVGDGGAALTSMDGIKWSSITTGVNDNLGSVIWGNNEFVTVGENGSILTSSDAFTWSYCKYRTNLDFHRIIWTGSQYVIVGKDRSNKFCGVVLASKDGKVWRETSMSSYTSLNDIVWDGEKYIGVENEGAVWQSKDLSNWMKTTYETAGDMGSIIWNGKQFVIAAAEVMITSNDGYNWTEHKYDKPDFIQSIVWTGDKFVAVGIYGHVLTSQEGLNWSFIQDSILQSAAIAEQNSTETESAFAVNTTEGSINYKNCSWIKNDGISAANIKGMAYGKGMYVIAGQDGFISVSKDLKTWKSCMTPGKINFKGIVFEHNIFVAYGDGAIFYSKDAINWNPSDFQTDMKLSGLTWDGNKFICVGEDGLIAYSYDGNSWNETAQITNCDYTCVYSNGNRTILFGCNNKNENIIIILDKNDKWTFGKFSEKVSTDPVVSEPKCYNALIFGNGRFVAVGDNGKVAMSKDGLSWFEQKSGVKNFLYGIAFDGKYFTAVGGDMLFGGGTVITSKDGINWAKRSLGTNINYLKSVKFVNKHIYIVGDGGAIYSSNSGNLSSWQQYNLGINDWFSEIVYGNGKFVAISNWIFGKSKIYISENGKNWSIACDANGYTINHIVWSGELFLCVGFNGIVFSSKDGVKWSVRNAGHNVKFNSVLFTDGKFIAIGFSHIDNSNAVYESNDGIHWNPVSSIPVFISSNGKGYIAKSRNAKLYSSDDLQEWEEISDVPNNNTRDIIWAKDYYVMVCSDSNSKKSWIYISKDGREWRSSLSVTDAILTTASVCNGNVFVTGYNGKAYVSRDGQYWYECKTNNSNCISGCVSNDKETFLYGENGTILFAK